jgi:enamine deaminase RidA (YjgF/YER057c/UK114 family)
MRFLPLVAAACAVSLLWGEPQRKKKEEETQTLQAPKDLPTAISADPRRLVFRVTPLSAKGLLSQQVRDALRAVSRDAGNEVVLKIRAFVAGSGDLRRVRDLVSEHFTDRRQPLPVLSLVQAGGLPLDGAQVIFEYITASRKVVNPRGLVWIGAQTAESESPTDPVPPLTSKALAGVRDALKAAGSEPADVLRVSCFFSSLENLAATRQQVESEYPRAALSYIQTERAPGRGLAACEAVARSRTAGAKDPRAAIVTAPGIVLTGTQISFGYEEKDARLAFERLKRALEQSGVSMTDVVFAHFYPLAPRIAAQVTGVRGEFFSGSPPGTMLVFEGLPSRDAGFGVDVIAVRK